MTRPQVIVAGAGPVGLTAAHELARRGLRVRLIDAATGPARTSRAVATHPRTLETYDQMGIVDRVVELGRKNRAFTMYAQGRRLVRLDADYSTMPTRYPYTLIIEQTATEAVLREAVARLGVEVEWGCGSRTSRRATPGYGYGWRRRTAPRRDSTPRGSWAATEGTAPYARGWGCR